MPAKTPPVYGTHAPSPRLTVLGAALVAAAVALGLGVPLWLLVLLF